MKKVTESQSRSAGMAAVDASLGENHIGMVKHGRDKQGDGLQT